MSTPEQLVTDALAAFRLTRLVTSDTITEAPRQTVVMWAFRHLPIRPTVEPGSTVVEALEDWEGHGEPVPKLATLVTCRWCASVHVAIIAVCLRRFAPKLWDPLSKALALSAVSALVARLED